MSADLSPPERQMIGLPKYTVPSNSSSAPYNSYEEAFNHHWKVLAKSGVDALNAKPLMFITIVPRSSMTSASSSLNKAAIERYSQINRELNDLVTIDQDENGVELGAINTAKALVRQLQSREIAPPELAPMGSEALIMLWVVENTKLALTITDGRFGYTVRRDRKTIQRQSNISPETFDVRRLK